MMSQKLMRTNIKQNDEQKSTAERSTTICNVEQVNAPAACKGCPPIALVCNTAGQQCLDFNFA